MILFFGWIFIWKVDWIPLKMYEFTKGNTPHLVDNCVWMKHAHFVVSILSLSGMNRKSPIFGIYWLEKHFETYTCRCVRVWMLFCFFSHNCVNLYRANNGDFNEFSWVIRIHNRTLERLPIRSPKGIYLFSYKENMYIIPITLILTFESKCHNRYALLQKQNIRLPT